MIDSLGIEVCCYLNGRLPRFRWLWLWLWNRAIRYALRREGVYPHSAHAEGPRWAARAWRSR